MKTIEQTAHPLPDASSYAVVDLHLHLDGSLSIPCVRDLAAMQGISLPEEDSLLRERLQVSPECRNLSEYLEKFAFPVSLLQSFEGISHAVYCLKEELRAAGLWYVEIRFAPQKHQEGTLSQERAVEAALAGAAASSLPSNLILCCMRGAREEINRETLRVTKEFLGQGVVAADLAGAEALFPNEVYEGLFSLARREKIPFTLHAGEAAGADSVKRALDFGASRIGHGVRSAEDPALLSRLARDGIPLELCPTSNLNTGVFSSYSEFPLRKFLSAGVTVSLNTDNLSVSRTSLAAEYRNLTKALRLEEKEWYQLALSSVRASFAHPSLKKKMETELEKKLRRKETL